MSTFQATATLPPPGYVPPALSASGAPSTGPLALHQLRWPASPSPIPSYVLASTTGPGIRPVSVPTYTAATATSRAPHDATPNPGGPLHQHQHLAGPSNGLGADGHPRRPAVRFFPPRDSTKPNAPSLLQARRGHAALIRAARLFDLDAAEFRPHGLHAGGDDGGDPGAQAGGGGHPLLPLRAIPAATAPYVAPTLAPQQQQPWPPRRRRPRVPPWRRGRQPGAMRQWLLHDRRRRPSTCRLPSDVSSEEEEPTELDPKDKGLFNFLKAVSNLAGSTINAFNIGGVALAYAATGHHKTTELQKFCLLAGGVIYMPFSVITAGVVHALEGKAKDIDLATTMVMTEIHGTTRARTEQEIFCTVSCKPITAPIFSEQI